MFRNVSEQTFNYFFNLVITACATYIYTYSTLENQNIFNFLDIFFPNWLPSAAWQSLIYFNYTARIQHFFLTTFPPFPLIFVCLDHKLSCDATWSKYLCTIAVQPSVFFAEMRLSFSLAVNAQVLKYHVLNNKIISFY